MSVPDADSRVERMLDGLAAAIRRDRQEWVIREESQAIVKIITDAVKPASLHRAVTEQMALTRNKPLKKDGENGRTVSKQSHIPYATLMKAVLREKAGIITQAKRRGPPSAFPKCCEDDIVAWVCGMQHEGHPVDRHTIMVKATQVYRRLVPTQPCLMDGTSISWLATLN
ncbi:hypothetical protein DYB31_014356 [Aphanomyces astaci]|uniref:HTH CENPB-type domain-containing protein n=1 Tax=Aphanomyces astaci TaxID=112090 RepID=A0A397EDE5_APHAT|nr:hypothetical protein DYB31_014356 [Aphanomyces astaci]